MAALEIHNAALFAAIDKGPLYLEEAAFGLQYVAPAVAALPAGARILEVGSGPGILLGEFAHRHPDLDILGIEPMAGGFAFFADLLRKNHSENTSLRVHAGGYESFVDDGTFDLIYSVNVMEHLDDWSDFLRFIHARLSGTGRALILCPNYGFPYESHVGIPTIVNKAVTGRLFKRRIAAFETEFDCPGLWQSLNFVHYRAVARVCRELGLECAFDPRICTDMIERLGRDEAFAARHARLRKPAEWLHASGILTWLTRFSLVKAVLPYLHLEIRKLPD